MTAAITHPFPAPPAPDAPLQVAPGIFWVRVPLPMPPGHVNALVLQDTDGWTVVDPGLDTPAIRAQWAALLAGPLAARPVVRVLVTHHHVDHIGMAGWFTAQGATLITTRTAWLTARSLTLERQEVASAAAITFWRLCGLAESEIARRSAERPWNMADHCAPLPPSFRRIAEGDVIHLAGRAWTVRCGNGHAPEHATLWSGDLVIGGDQLLPGISPNLGVWPTEPEADPVGEWLESCSRLAGFATQDQMILPGHKLPYRGLPHRLAALRQNHESALDRLSASLDAPLRVVDCFGAMFSRPIGAAEYNLALAETLGHLNRLLREGRVTRVLDAGGAWLWQRA